MTEKLYYLDSSLKDFTAVVIGIIEVEEKKAVILDRTAFFPEGGGQKSDIGSLNSYEVYDVQETSDGILHYCNGHFEIGESVSGSIDMTLRFRRMQAHSGEHVFSGIVHSLLGFDNVGFHMDDELMTIDFNGCITDEQLVDIEQRANAVVYADVDVKAEILPPEELSKIDYRSKLELTENVRIVTIDGIDRCACCAVHVKKTGEIGLIKVLLCQSHRGGVRLTLICGEKALHDYEEKYSNVLKISNLLSVKQHECADAVEKLLHTQDLLKKEIAAQKSRYNKVIVSSAKPGRNVIVFAEELKNDDLREIAMLALEKCENVCAVFSGNDTDGYAYVITSKVINLQLAAKRANADLCGRGGGKNGMIQGSFKAPKEVIEKYFSVY